LQARGSMPPLRDFIAGIHLPQLVEHYAGPGKHSGGKYLFSCPNPDHYDAHASFSVFMGKGGAWRCHCLSQCGHVGDALDFMAWQLRCDKSEALRELRKWAGQPNPLPHSPTAKKATAKVATQETDPGYTALDDVAAMADYLASRQWPAEVVEAFGLRIVRLNRASERDTVRVLHPFIDYRSGEWCATSWQARRLDNVEASRWLGPRGASLPLYNVRALDAEALSAAIVCEGPADTVTAWLAVRDVPGIAVVGVPGSQAWRSEWAAYFTGLAVVIAGDGDNAGAAFTSKVARDLRAGASVLVAACPPEGVNDLTDMAKVHGLQAVRQLLTKALPVQVPDFAPTTTPPGDEWAQQWAVITSHFTNAVTVCRVCMTPTPHTYCDKCSALTKNAHGKAMHWAQCDNCGEHSLAGHGRKCLTCGGSRVKVEVQP
jgi:hypothetical protein